MKALATVIRDKEKQLEEEILVSASENGEQNLGL